MSPNTLNTKISFEIEFKDLVQITEGLTESSKRTQIRQQRRKALSWSGSKHYPDRNTGKTVYYDPGQ